MEEKLFSEEEEKLIQKLAEYIDVQAIAEGLVYNLREAKNRADVKTETTFEELKDFYLFILEDFWEQAKAYIQTHYS
jgi:hypothetical protein